LPLSLADEIDKLHIEYLHISVFVRV